MRILIVGGGDIGSALAEDLLSQADREVVVVESDPGRCEVLSERLDALILEGDGTDPQMLDKAMVRSCEALVATTGSDALNAVVAMLGRLAGVKKIIVKLNTAGLRAACHAIGVEAVITPKLAAVRRIAGILQGVHLLDLEPELSPGMRVEALPVGASAGRRLAELEVGKGLRVVAILRGSQVMFPRDGVELGDRDRLLVLAEDEDDLHRLKKRLTEHR